MVLIELRMEHEVLAGVSSSAACAYVLYEVRRDARHDVFDDREPRQRFCERLLSAQIEESARVAEGSQSRTALVDRGLVDRQLSQETSVREQVRPARIGAALLAVQ